MDAIVTSDSGAPEARDHFVDKALDTLAAGNAAAAVLLFECALAADPQHSEAMHGLVRALEDSGRAKDALLLAQQLIDRDPEDVLALTRLSMIYQHQGRIAEAEDTATRAKLLGWKLELRADTPTKTVL